MATLIIETAEGVELRQELAGAGSRLTAGLLDLLLMCAAIAVLALGLVIASAIDPSGVARFMLGIVLGGTLLVGVFYPFVFHVLDHGRTPGKKALGLRVASADGNPANTLQLLIRSLLLPIDVLLFVPMSFGLILIAVTPKQQRLGDLAGGTLVLREGRAVLQREPFAGQRWSTSAQRQLLLAPGHVARIGPEDLAFLRGVLAREGLDDRAHKRLVSDAAKFYAKRLDLHEIGDPRAALKEIYLFAREAREPTLVS